MAFDRHTYRNGNWRGIFLFHMIFKNKKQLEKAIEEMKKFAKKNQEPVEEYLDFDIAQATLTQTNEIIKLIDSQELKDCFKKLCKDFPIKYQWKLGKIYAKFRKERRKK